MADLPSKAGVSGQWMTSAYNVKVDYVGTSGGIMRGTGADWFGPLNPITPYAPKEVASRQWDYQAGYNLALTPRQYEAVGFVTLRAISESYDLLRTVIETRKDQVARMGWNIKARDPKKQDGAAAKIKAATDFFSRPDGVNAWPNWLRMILEDLFVIDAPTLYMQRSRSGKLLALLPIDGATIVPKIDDWGRTPRPYVGQDGKQVIPVAYQQVLKGIPAVDYSVNDLIYRPRNARSNRAYGYSPVEQIVTTVNIALRRQLFLLDYYTEGNIPDSLIGVPENWTPDQIKTWQDNWDNYFEGNLAARRRAKFVPGGVGKTFVQTKEPELKNEFDEWLARIVCYVFSVSPQAFVKQMNRASADTQKQIAEEEGLVPVLQWIKTLMNDLLEAEFNSPELEFVWGEDKETDEAAQAVILEGFVAKGILTINEARAKIGLDPLPEPAADQPMIVTATGYVPLNANTIEGKQAMLDAFGPPPAPPGAVLPEQEGQPPAKGGRGEDGKRAREVGKRAPGPFRALTPLSLDRKALKAPQENMQAAWEGILAQHAKAAASAISATLSEVAKADGPPETERDRSAWSDEQISVEVEHVLDRLELDISDAVMAEVASPLADAARDAGLRAVAQAVGIALGDDPSDGNAPSADELGEGIFDKINTRAVKWADEHAAELVSGVNDTTRNAVRSAISEGMAAGERYTEIIARVEALSAFSSARAELIAETEIASANGMGALQGLFQARDAGVTVKKGWLTAALILERVCLICLGNEAISPIALEKTFPSGDLAPPGHPRCRCALVSYVPDEATKSAQSRFACD